MKDVFGFLDELAQLYDLDRVENEALGALADAGEADAPDLWRYVAWSRFEQGRLRHCLDAARESGDALFSAKAHFHLWEFDDARQALVDFAGEGEDLAEAEWYRGLLLEFAGESGDAHFRAAARLEPDDYHEPERLDQRRIDEVVNRAVAALPESISKEVEETVIEVRRLPRPYPDVDPLTLGLYIGHDRLQRSIEDGPALPPRIEIYQRCIEIAFQDAEIASDELRVTLLHEIGHHLGLDEARLDDLGFG